MKRFYTLVSTQEKQGEFCVLLDGRSVKTPMKAELSTPHENLANAIVQEWAGHGDTIDPDMMPLTQILSTKIDRVGKERDAMQAYVFKYLDTDLLCYRTDDPSELKSAQEEAWNPVLKWFEELFGPPLETTYALAALTQNKLLHDDVQAYIQALDDDRFAVLQLITALSGSLVLGVAALEKHYDAKNIFNAMRIEENFKAGLYNEEFYGPDPAQDKKDKAIQRDLEAAIHYLECIA